MHKCASRRIFCCSLLLLAKTYANEDSGGSAQANNPLANMTAFNIQNYYIGDLSKSDKTANQAWFRFAKPFDVGDSKWLLRASLPINTFPTAPSGSRETSVGDLNIFAAYLIDVGNPSVSFGVGPQVTAPTAGKDELGSEQWSGGLVNVLFNASSPVFQYGYLLSWQHSFGGNESREDVSVAAFQPFAFYQLGHGTYLRSTPIWTYDFEGDTYGVPLGIGIGQVIKRKNMVYNVFAEPQFSIADEGARQPRWQVFLGLNLQFLD